MPIYKWVREELEKLSYIDKVEVKKGKVYFYYTFEDAQRYRTLPYRCGRDEVLKILREIRQETGVDFKKMEEYKKKVAPPLFHIPSLTGETDDENNTRESN